MSKRLAGFYGQKSIRRTPQPKVPEYTVLGVNQPLVAPESEATVVSDSKPASAPVQEGNKQRTFWFSALWHRFIARGVR